MKKPDYSHLQKYRIDAASPGFHIIEYSPTEDGDFSMQSVTQTPILYWRICTEADPRESWLIGSIDPITSFSHGPETICCTILFPHGGCENHDSGYFPSVEAWLANLESGYKYEAAKIERELI